MADHSRDSLQVTTPIATQETRTVFIVGDDATLTSVVSSVLEGQGFTTSKCSAGKEALALLEDSPTDLVIVTEQLSDIDGIGWIVRLRQDNPDIKVVFISNSWKDAGLYQQLTKEFQVSLVVHRPLNQALFAAQIENQFISAPLNVDASNQDEPGLNYLRSKFAGILKERLDKIQIAIDSAKAKPQEPKLLAEALRLAHNLKGTSRSAGYNLVGEAAEHLERSLKILESTKLAEHKESWIDIDGFFELLKRNANQDLKQAGHESGASTVNEADAAAQVKVAVLGGNEIQDRYSPKTSGTPIELMFFSKSQEVIEKAQAAPMDAVLIEIDVSAPEPSLKLARELRGLTGHANLPVAFISDGALGKLAQGETTHAGASLVLSKPLNSPALNEAIDYLLKIGQGGRPRILIIDDDEDFAELVAATLGREGMLVKAEHDPANVLGTLQGFVPDLVLLDVRMPAVSGFEVCRMLRASERWQDLPILFLTAETGLDARVNAFDAGADDYLPKPFASKELLARVKGKLERARFIKEKADKDGLTGLLLRRAFVTHLKPILAESQANSLTLSLALIDVDHFKKVNDTYGHIAGDMVLEYFGALLSRRFRVEDLRCRWGGEEFIVAFRHVSSEVMKSSLERALEELRTHVFEGEKGEKFSVTFSSGVASFPSDGDTTDELVRIADHRLYKAKETGRNRIIITDIT